MIDNMTADRFFALVTKRGKCWRWKGAVIASGFGMFRDDEGRTVPAHHFAFRWSGGALPPKTRLRHSCGNRLCVNPAHLWAATPENVLLHNMRPHGSGCWEWTGRRTPKMGYGILTVLGRKSPTMAHRLAYEVWRGKIPDGQHVLHGCDNAWCINPDHLFIGTKGDNNKDRDAKGRTARGERIAKSKRGELAWNARITDEDVRAIRASAAAGVRQSRLAELYRIDQSQISNIVHRKAWAHVS